VPNELYEFVKVFYTEYLKDVPEHHLRSAQTYIGASVVINVPLTHQYSRVSEVRGEHDYASSGTWATLTPAGTKILVRRWYLGMTGAPKFWCAIDK
jgi:hypothetical protein